MLSIMTPINMQDQRENAVTRYGQNSQPNRQSSIPSNNTMTAGQNHITVDSAGAIQPLQLCSTAQNVGTVNIGTATSQSILPSFSATITTPLASLLSSIVPHLNLPSVPQSYALPSASSNATPSTSQQKSPTVKSNQPFFITTLTNRIKECSGCGALFHEFSGLQSDYILGHIGQDWFPQNGQWQLGTSTTIYEGAVFFSDPPYTAFLTILFTHIKTGCSHPCFHSRNCFPRVWS